MMWELEIDQNVPPRTPRLVSSGLGLIDQRGSLRVGAVDIGGSHVAAASVTLEKSGAQIRHRVFEAIDPHASAATIVARIASVAASVGESDLWAVAVPGPFDYARGRGAFEGVGKFDALSGVDLRAELAREFDVPPVAVGFVNDATAYGVGEWAFGAARGRSRAICLTLGTGIGSVFLLDGVEVDHGEAVPPNGHMHLQLFRGRPLEDFVSSRAMVAHYRSLTGRELTVKQICGEVRSGNHRAGEVLDAAMSVLGRCIGPWAESFGADAIVIGGSIARAWDLLEEPLRRGLASRAGSVDQGIVLAKAELMDEAPLLGAAAWLSGRL